ncbi:MAG: hypothetical protein RR646_06325 [Erysipelotrichaceae bacterium]
MKLNYNDLKLKTLSVLSPVRIKLTIIFFLMSIVTLGINSLMELFLPDNTVFMLIKLVIAIVLAIIMSAFFVYVYKLFNGSTLNSDDISIIKSNLVNMLLLIILVQLARTLVLMLIVSAMALLPFLSAASLFISSILEVITLSVQIIGIIIIFETRSSGVEAFKKSLFRIKSNIANVVYCALPFMFASAIMNICFNLFCYNILGQVTVSGIVGIITTIFDSRGVLLATLATLLYTVTIAVACYFQTYVLVFIVAINEHYNDNTIDINYNEIEVEIS